MKFLSGFSGATPRPIAVTAASQPAIASQWKCNSCTFLNTPDVQECLVCMTSRSLPPPPPVVTDRQSDSGGVATGPKNGKNHVWRKDLDNEFKSRSPDEEVVVHLSLQFANGKQVEQAFVKSVSEVHRKLQPLLGNDDFNGSGSTKNVERKDPGGPLSPSSASPQYDPKTGFGTGPVHKETLANAGKAGGERVIRPEGALVQEETPNSSSSSKASPSSVKKSPSKVGNQGQKPFGPPQHAAKEVITLADRNAQLADGGGARVNQDSSARFYDLGNYEKSVAIDPLRHTRSPEFRDEGEVLGPTNASAATSGVPIEVASVSSKIRNIVRVGGERVKEMDHFVASVETPIVRIALNGEEEKSPRGGSLRRSDIGAFVQTAVRKDNLENSFSVKIQSDSFGQSKLPPLEFELLVEKQYRDLIIATAPPQVCYIVRYCQMFHWLLRHVYEVLGLELNAQTTQFYYMTTMRTDDLVCSVAEAPDNRIYVNAMVFEQSACFDLINDDPHKPRRIMASKIRELLSTWLTRVAVALYKHKQSPAGEAVGLYNKQIRARFYDKLLYLVENNNGGGGSQALNKFDEGVALMSCSTVVSGSNDAWAIIENASTCFQQALSESREKEDVRLLKQAKERLAMCAASSALEIVANHNQISPSPTPKPSLPASAGNSASASVVSKQPSVDSNSSALSQLHELFGTEMWSKEELMEVLKSTNGNVELAIEYLFSKSQ